MAKRKRLPTLTALDYFDLLARKLPPGWIWQMQIRDSGDLYLDGNPVPATRFGRILWALADELAYLHARIVAAFDECIPDTATETIDEWEADLGLPFAGYPTPSTLADRRAIVKVQDLMKGATNNEHFENLGANLGVTVDVYDDPDRLMTIVHSMPGDCVRADCTSECTAALVDFTTDAGERYAYFVDRYHPAGRAIYFTHETP